MASRRRPKRSPRPARSIARLIGQRIRHLRANVGLTQEKLAWESGLASKSYLSRIESGERLPTIEVLDKLARRLNVETRDLLIFPDRGLIDEAMEAVRLGGIATAKRVVAMAKPGE